MLTEIKGLKELKEVYSYMRRIGENVSDRNLYLLVENLSLPVIINEGLISSYDAYKVVGFISKAFGLENLSDNTISLSKIKYPDQKLSDTIKVGAGENGCEVIRLCLDNTFQYKDKIDFYMNKYGWFLSRIDDDETGQSLTYEKKFDTYCLCFQLRRYTNYLYRVVSEKRLDTVLRKGFKPKSKNSPDGYMNSERVYLYLNEPDSNEKLISFTKDPVVLRVDLSKINDDTKFYFDPRVNNALYTYEPIPSTAIELLPMTENK